MKKLIAALTVGLLSIGIFAGEAQIDFSKLPPEDFMAYSRGRMTVQNSFAYLRGKVTHLRRNRGGAGYYKVRFLVRFSKSVQARIIVNDNEVHELVKDYRSGYKNVKSNVPADKSILHSVGFKVEDLTMDFLDYPVKGEFAAERVKTVDCRVMLLQNSKTGEQVKVWISKEYLFPLKAEFFAKDSNVNGKPLRSLEITGFEKVDDYYVATEISLFSPQFRTRIGFSECRVYKADSPEAKAQFGN